MPEDPWGEFKEKLLANPETRAAYEKLKQETETSDEAPEPAPVIPKTVDEVREQLLTGILERGDIAPRAVPPSAARQPRSKGKKRKAETGDGKCTAYAPFGTKCKLCGKVHPV